MYRILGRLSSINVRKVVWTAAECDVEFELDETWTGHSQLTSAYFQKLTPFGKIPVLEFDGGSLQESNCICRLVAGVANRDDLLPQEAHARAAVERWMDWQATDLNAAWRPVFMTLVRGVPSSIDLDREITEWNAQMLILERHLADGRAYVATDCFTLADIVLALTAQRWLRTPIARPPAPNIAAWLSAQQARPAAKSWIDPRVD